ncbi:hypothetical protein GJAV_G00147590 [Gymnothorax javanicus]|nr:hypothetical protein GJAV_G00147590 [Gymnothorax javanicus]
MHAGRGDADEEPPSMLWGLDPIFSAYARLYIKDILVMKESNQVPGIYFYKLHPIFKVDVLGTVVCKREREDFFCYGVDDGTGVINCLCWKDEQWKEHSGPVEGLKSQVPGHGGFNPAEQLKKLLHAQRCSSHLEIGDVLRVRGPVKTSRGQREIAASTYYKVTDPVMAVQISWMLEVPQLYRKFYDQPFQFPSVVQGSDTTDADGVSSASSLIGRASRVLKDFLREKSVERFRPYDLEQQLVPLVSEIPQQAPEQQVTEHDKELHRVTRDIIREDSRLEKYAEKGSHILRILSSVRQRYSRNVSKTVVEVVLRTLECNSEIISTTDNYYTVL